MPPDNIEETPLNAAFRFYDLGFNVVAMRRGSRATIGPWLPKKDNRMDRAALRKAFQSAEARPGAILDATSRIIMVEGDGANSARSLAALNLPPTLTVQSRRGPHLFFKWPEGEPYPRGSLYLVPKGNDDELELKVNSLTGLPPQEHPADPSFVLSYAPESVFTIAVASPELVQRVREIQAEQHRPNEGPHPDPAWSRTLIDLVNGGHLDDNVVWTGSWTAGGIRHLRCPFADDHAGGERERSSAYLITRDGAKMLCDKPQHERSVLGFLVATGWANTEKDAKKKLKALDLMPTLAATSGKPELCTTNADLEDLTYQAVEILHTVNKDTPSLFLRNFGLVRVERDDEEQPRVQRLSVDAVRGKLAEQITWSAERQHGRVTEFPPKDVAQNIVARDPAKLPFPPIRGVSDVPFFRPDGTLCTTVGYDEATGLYFAPPPGYEVPTVPDEPTDAEVAAAKALLLEEVFADFPFVADADRAHAVALALLPFARPLIAGPTPQHLATAPAARSGKGKLIRAALNIGRRSAPPATAWPTKEEEMEKRLLAFFAAGAPVIIFDNVEGKVHSPSYALALTEPRFKGRTLGISAAPEFDVRTVFAMTGNNAELHHDIVKRTVPIRLDAQREDPEERTDFRHPDLERYIHENNPELLRAVLTMIRAWIVRGRPGAPDATPTLGGFDAWRAVIGGILRVAGIPGFLGNLEDFNAVADPDRAKWRTFYALWKGTHRDAPQTARDLVPLAVQAELPIWWKGREAADAFLLSKQLRKQRNKWYNSLRVEEAGTRDGSVLYRLVQKVDSVPTGVQRVSEAVLAAAMDYDEEHDF